MRRLDKSEIRHNIAARTDHDMVKHHDDAEKLHAQLQAPKHEENPAWKTPDHVRLGIAKKEIEERLKNRLHIGDPDARERKKRKAALRMKNKFAEKFQERPFSLKAPDDWEELDESDSDDTSSMKSQYSDTANAANLTSLDLPYYGQDFHHEKHEIDNTIHNRDTSMFEDLDADYDGTVRYDDFVSSKMRFKSHADLHSHLTKYKSHNFIEEVAENYTHHEDLGIPLPRPKPKPKTFNDEYFGKKYRFRSETQEADERRHDGGGQVDTDGKKNFSALHMFETFIDLLTMQRARPKAAKVPLLVNRKLESLSKDPNVLVAVDFKPEEKVDMADVLSKQLMARQQKTVTFAKVTSKAQGEDDIDSDEEIKKVLPAEAALDDSKGFATTFRNKIDKVKEDIKREEEKKHYDDLKKKIIHNSGTNFKNLDTFHYKVDPFEATKKKVVFVAKLKEIKEGKVKVASEDKYAKIASAASKGGDEEHHNPNVKRPKSFFEKIFDEDSPDEDFGMDKLTIKSTPVSVGWRTSVIKHQMEIIKEASKPPPTVLSKLKDVVRYAVSPFYKGPDKRPKPKEKVYMEEDVVEEPVQEEEEVLVKKANSEFKADVEKLINDKRQKAEEVDPDFKKLQSYHSKYTQYSHLSLTDQLAITHPSDSSSRPATPGSRPVTPKTLSQTASSKVLIPAVDLSKSLRSVPSSLDMVMHGKSSSAIAVVALDPGMRQLSSSSNLTASNIAAIHGASTNDINDYVDPYPDFSPRSDASYESRVSYISSASEINRHLRSAASMGDVKAMNSSGNLKGGLNRSNTSRSIKEDMEKDQSLCESFYNKDVSLSRTNVLKNIGLQTIREADASFIKEEEQNLENMKSIHVKEKKLGSLDEEKRLETAKKLLYSKLHNRYEQDPHQLQLFQKEANDKMSKHKVEQECIMENYMEEIDTWPKTLEYKPIKPRQEDNKYTIEQLREMLARHFGFDADLSTIRVINRAARELKIANQVDRLDTDREKASYILRQLRIIPTIPLTTNAVEQLGPGLTKKNSKVKFSD